MGAVEVKTNEFVETIERDGIVLIDWWAPWCGPCRAFAPVFEEAAAKHADVVFGRVNTEDEPGLVNAFRIQSIPTLMAFRDGILLFARPGMLPAAALEDLIGKLRAVDMDDVKRKIAHAAEADCTEEPSRPKKTESNEAGRER